MSNTVYKSLFLNNPSPDVLGLELLSDSVTRGHSFKLLRKYVSASIRKSFFTERVLPLWNSLPPSVFSGGTISSFKRSVTAYLQSEGAHYRPLAACATEIQ